MKCRLAILLSVACVLPAQAEEIYTWVDAQGVVHYGATPPPGQKVERENIRYNRSDPAVAEAARKRWDDEETQRREQAGEAERNGAEQGAQQAERRRACADTREIIRRLETAPAARYRREDGSFMNYSPDEIASRMAEARAREQEYCD